MAMGLLLLAAKIFGNMSERLKVPSLAGELIAGMLLGPILGIVILGDFFTGFMTVGLVIILFIAGTEVHYKDIIPNIYGGSTVAAAGGLLSFFLGYLVGIFLFHDGLIGLAIGTVLVSTSNSSLFTLLMKTGKLKSELGKFIVTSTIADDIVGILIVSIFSYATKSANIALNPFDLFKLLLVALGFYFFILTTGSKAVDRVITSLGKFKDENIFIAIPIAVALILAYITDNFGLSLAAGAFLAGMTMSNNKLTEHVIVPKVTTLSEGFIIPLFYAIVGTSLVLVGIDLVIVVAIFLAAVFGKFIGCAIASRFFGYNQKSSVFVGISLIPRGNENIAFAQIVFLLGIFSMTAYSSTILAIMLTAIFTPVFMILAERK